MYEDKKYLEDISFILQNYTASPEKTVENWSSAECEDAIFPLTRILRFIRRVENDRLLIKPGLIGQVVVDIVTHSHLAQILKYDAASACVRFRADFPLALRAEIQSLVDAAETGGVE